MKRLSRYFIQGLLVVVPIVVTGFVAYKLFQFIDGLLWFKMPGMGFLLTVVIITAIGFLASNFISRNFLQQMDVCMGHVPLVKILYFAVKDLLEAFVGKKKTFDRPVLISPLKDSHIKVIGFITADDLEHLGIKDSIAVYLPQSYNFGGNVVILPKTQVHRLDKPGADVMAFVISGGVSGKPEHSNQLQKPLK